MVRLLFGLLNKATFIRTFILKRGINFLMILVSAEKTSSSESSCCKNIIYIFRTSPRMYKSRPIYTKELKVSESPI